MSNGIAVGLGFVLLAGVLQGSFTLPMKRMPGWRWENTWLVYSIGATLVMPWLLVALTVPHSGDILRACSGGVLAEVALFGLGWGIGSVFFGLGIAAVGMGLGFAIILGMTASIGSLLPLLVLDPARLRTHQGTMLIEGLVLVTLGIILCSIAGSRREKDRAAAAPEAGRPSFLLGLLICALSGIFSPMLNFSFVFGKNLHDLTLNAGASQAMANNLVWAIALGGGFFANAGYCVYLLGKNHTWGVLTARGTPAWYWVGSVIMAFLWFAGIASYGIGAVDLGSLGGVIGWPLFIVSMIVTANLWGAATGEWQGARRSTYAYSFAGLAFLLTAIYVISRGSSS